MAYASILAVCLGCAQPVAGQEPAYFTPGNVLSFADFLFEEEDYLRAAVEYERYLSLGVLPDSEAASVRFKIALCFRFVQDFDRSINAFQLVVDRFPETDAALNSRVQIAYSLFLSGRYRESRSSISDSLPLVRTEERQRALANLEGLNLLFEKRWEAADEFFRSLSRRAPGDPLVAAFSQVAAEGLGLPRKNAFVAGVLSTLVPGAGRMYAGRKADGLLSLVTIAATSWQAYSGFDRHGTRSVRGWIYGSLATFLYVGNVYGSVIAVRIFNEQSETKLLERAGVSISVAIR